MADNFKQTLASAPGFTVGKPTSIRESNENINDLGVNFAAFMEGVNANEFTTMQAIAGSSPVSIGGRRVATVSFRSQKRSMGHLVAQLTLEDGTILAQFDRAQASGIMQTGWGADIIITSPPGRQYATMSSSPSGSFIRTDGGSGRIDFTKVGFVGQPAFKWCCIAALCCVPTLSIATIVACTKMAGAPQLYDVSYSGPAGTASLPQLAFEGDGVLAAGHSATGTFDFGSQLDGAGKLDFLLVVCAHVAAAFCTPDTTKDTTSDFGGGGGGCGGGGCGGGGGGD